MMDTVASTSIYMSRYLENISNVSTTLSSPSLPTSCTILDSRCMNKWRDFQFFALAVIIPLGLVFNSVCFGVFAVSWMRRTIPGRYFMALALADNLVLTGELIKWLNTSDPDRGPKLGMDFVNTVDGMCKFFNFLRYGARMWSSWVTISITIERFLTVTFPFKIRRISSPTKAVIVVAIEAAFCFCLASFAFFTLYSGPNRGKIMCIIHPEKYSIYAWFILILQAGIGELVFPSIIVLVFTVLIIRKLLQARKRRQSLSTTETMSRRRQSHPTIALVIIAITFVTIRMPYVIMFHINQFSQKIWPDITHRERYIIYVMYRISEVLAVLNYAINFLLFCVAGNTFRVEMMKCCPWAPVAEPRISQTRTSSVSLYRERNSIRNSINTEIYLRTYGKTSVRKLTAGNCAALLEDSPSSSGSSSVKAQKPTDSEGELKPLKEPDERDLIIVENNSGQKKCWMKKPKNEIVYKWRDHLLNEDNTPNNTDKDDI